MARFPGGQGSCAYSAPASIPSNAKTVDHCSWTWHSGAGLPYQMWSGKAGCHDFELECAFHPKAPYAEGSQIEPSLSSPNQGLILAKSKRAYQVTQLAIGIPMRHIASCTQTTEEAMTVARMKLSLSPVHQQATVLIHGKVNRTLA